MGGEHNADGCIGGNVSNVGALDNNDRICYPITAG